MSVQLIKARDLHKYYSIKSGYLQPSKNLKALAGASFELYAGKTLAVVGESGCGKSTLARLLTMIEKPTSGQLSIDGIDVAITTDKSIKKQLSHFLNFESNEKNSALILNNFDWMSKFTLLEFIRDIGKHISVNYMMSKDSVKNRISSESSAGMSFTEFTYQLVQGYDFLHLYKNYKCTIQMGGSDQWGNITTGTELIRRVDSGKGYALTCPLITKSDGSKFGKTEGGNIWLDPNKTSVFKFYQYWLNTSDLDAEKYIKIFTFLSKEEIDNLINTHKLEPHKRSLQKVLAKEITIIVHSINSFKKAEQASSILYSKTFKQDIELIDESTFLEVSIPPVVVMPVVKFLLKLKLSNSND